MSKGYLEIENEALIAFVNDAKKAGHLKDVSLSQVKHNFSKTEGPVRIPVNLSAYLELIENPIIKKVFGKLIDKKIVDLLNQATSPAE